VARPRLLSIVSRSHLLSVVCTAASDIVKHRFPFMAKGIFGERLKRERELREVSVDELTKATRISQRFLEALENEDWARLPGGVFGRAFVRTIARYLGLDEDALLAEYDVARGDTAQTARPLKPEERIPSPPKWLPIVALLVLLAVLAGLLYAGRYAWHRYAARHASQQSSGSSAQPEPPAAPVSAAQAFISTAGPSQSSSADMSRQPALRLSLSTSAATRVRILADSALVLDAEVPAGDTRHFTANQQFEVTAADSSAVLLELNGQAMPPLGAPGASGTMVLSQKDLRPAPRGNSQP
jgi:cytoskeleton protein RodZ